jgi:hypothetical protein
MELVLKKLPKPFVGTLGGIPRAIQYLNSIIQDYPELIDNPSKLFEALVDKICEVYSISRNSISTQVLNLILRFSISGKHVRRDDNVGKALIGELEGNGVFFLEKIKGVSDKYRIIVPLVFLASLNRSLALFDPRFITYRPIVKASDLEVFSRDFHVFYNNLLVDLGVTETTFGELFRGALMSSSLAERKIQLSRMARYNSKKDELNNYQFNVMDASKMVNLKDKCSAVWFGRNCITCDNIYSYPKQSGDKTFAVLEELKNTMFHQEDTSSDIKRGTILSESRAAFALAEVMNKKERKGGKNIATKYGPVLTAQEFELFFLFTTNCRLETPLNTLKKKILSDDHTMIVGKDNFKDRFAMFACIALGDEGIDPSPNVFTSEQDDKDKKNT